MDFRKTSGQSDGSVSNVQLDIFFDNFHSGDSSCWMLLVHVGSGRKASITLAEWLRSRPVSRSAGSLSGAVFGGAGCLKALLVEKPGWKESGIHNVS